MLTDADRALLADLAGKFDALAARLDQRVDLDPLHEMVMREIVNAHKIHDAVRADFLKILDGKRLQRIRQNVATVAMAAPAVVIPRNAPVFAGRDPKPKQNTRSAPKYGFHVNGIGGEADPSIGRSGLRRMLIALAQRPNGLTRSQLGLRARVSAKGGSFDTYLSKARTSGWVNGDNARILITDAGLTALGPYEPLPEGPELIAHYLREFGTSGAARMLQVITDAYPRALTRSEVSEAANVSAAGGSFDTYLSKLRTLELVEGRSELRASEELFS